MISFPRQAADHVVEPQVGLAQNSFSALSLSTHLLFDIAISEEARRRSTNQQHHPVRPAQHIAAEISEHCIILTSSQIQVRHAQSHARIVTHIAHKLTQLFLTEPPGPPTRCLTPDSPTYVNPKTREMPRKI